MDIEPTGIIPAAASAVTGAIRRAAQLTGASFQYLLATAKVESKLNPQAAAPTSTARGPFQFVEQTWLATLKEQGPALGYGRYADAIVRAPSGRYEITDPALVEPIMNLRTDPAASATLAGAFTKSNAAKLTGWIGRAPTDGELYLAHFMGAAGAAKLIGYVDTMPRAQAAQIFPAAAAANPSIFYDQSKRARSVADVYKLLVGRYETARASPGVPTAPVTNVAAIPNPMAPTVPVTPVSLTTRTGAVRPQPAAPIPPDDAPKPAAPVAPVARTYSDLGRIATAPANAPPQDDAVPVFHSLFLAVDRPKPISSTVAALWGNPSTSPAPSQDQPSTPPAPPNPAATTPPVAAPPGTIGLFQEQPADSQALFRAGPR